MWLRKGCGSHTLTSGAPSTTMEGMSITHRAFICVGHVSQDKQQVINTSSSVIQEFIIDKGREFNKIIIIIKIIKKCLIIKIKRCKGYTPSLKGRQLQSKAKCFAAIKQLMSKAFIAYSKKVSLLQTVYWHAGRSTLTQMS